VSETASRHGAGGGGQAASLRAHLDQPGTLTGMAEMWQAWGTKQQPKDTGGT
jgi:hypothetical protein